MNLLTILSLFVIVFYRKKVLFLEGCMSVLFLLFCAVGMAIQGAFNLVERKGDFKRALILKTKASVVFIIAGFYCMPNCTDSRRAVLVVAGLIMGGVGDFFLNLQFVVKEELAQTIFVVGGVAFYAGHIIYIVSMAPFEREVLLSSLVITAIITGILLIFVYKGKDIPIGLKIFGFFYIGAVALLTMVALARYMLNPASTASIIVAVGAALFTASDVVLIYDMFGEKKPWMRTANLVLYYASQLIIASSLLFVM